MDLVKALEEREKVVKLSLTKHSLQDSLGIHTRYVSLLEEGNLTEDNITEDILSDIIVNRTASSKIEDKIMIAKAILHEIGLLSKETGDKSPVIALQMAKQIIFKVEQYQSEIKRARGDSNSIIALVLETALDYYLDYSETYTPPETIAGMFDDVVGSIAEDNINMDKLTGEDFYKELVDYHDIY